MQAGNEKHSPDGADRRRHWPLFKASMAVFGIGLRLFGIYGRGVRNALDFGLTHLDFGFENLPVAFDGFRILHLSDLHADFLPATLARAGALVAEVEADICVLTGDYRRRVSGPFEQILPGLRDLVARITAHHGIYAILGNHDPAEMVPALEALGIRVLVNESKSLRQGGQSIHLTGTDDVHYFYTAAAEAALEATPEGFRIALVHSAELADVAAGHGFYLYLAGHTHGGQICLPGGRPIITHLSRFRHYASGSWQHGRMIGYSTTGTGVSGLLVRFNCPGEVALITLRRNGPPG